MDDLIIMFSVNVQNAHLAAAHQSIQIVFSGKISTWLNMYPQIITHFLWLSTWQRVLLILIPLTNVKQSCPFV